jgi:phosphate:Na+ symporter
MSEFSVAYFIAGLAFFLYGLRMTELNLRQAAGDRFRAWITKLTQSRVSAFMLGVVMTIIFQSSTATTVMLIGLAGIGYLSLRQAASVVLGADVGTTLLVLILASFVRFDMRHATLVFLVLAFFLNFIFRHGRALFLARAFLGFAFVLYGLGQIGIASTPLKQSPLVLQLIQAVASNPLGALIMAAIFTGLVQSSVAVLGILLSLSSSGLLTLPQAIPFVLGANLGSTIIPIMVGLRSKTDGRRLSLIHVGLKIIGIVALLPFIVPVAEEIQRWLDMPSYQVAAVHIFLNTALAVIFLPLIRWVAIAAEKWIPSSDNGKVFGPKYLDPQALDSPTLAFADVFREILRMAEITQKMCAQVLLPFEEVGTDTLQRLEELDDQVDHLDRDIKFYLAKMSQEQFTAEQSKRQLELLMLTHDLESIGDVMTKDLMELAEKKRRKGVSFSGDGWREIKEFHAKVMENFNLAITSFATGDIDLGKKVMRHKKNMASLEQELGQKHLRRLHQGLRESFDTSSIHLDILSNLRRINAIISKMAYPVMDRRIA